MSGPRGKAVPLMGALLSIGIAAGALTLSKDLRYSAYTCIGRNKTKIILRGLGVLALLTSFKNFPFVWHYRIFRAFIYQIYIQRHPWEPRHLFAPMITSSWNSLADCDYNFHKSNSTYFADLDIARAHLVAAIVKVGIRRLNKGDIEGLPQSAKAKKPRVDSYGVALGGVACMFQKEVEPMAQFEVYSRVLSWDRKWIYIVSHMVRAGKIKPKGYIMQPWRRAEPGYTKGLKEEEDDLKKYIYASSISRYVVKKGRLTVHPEIVLERSRLLPPRPEGTPLAPRSEDTSDTPPSVDTPNGDKPQVSAPEQVAAALTSQLATDNTTTQPIDTWSWDEMEAERLRGLKLAAHFDALSGLADELRADNVLGKFSDWI